MGEYKRICLFGLILFVTCSTTLMVLISGNTLVFVSKFLPTSLVGGLAMRTTTPVMSSRNNARITSPPLQYQVINRGVSASLRKTVNSVQTKAVDSVQTKAVDSVQTKAVDKKNTTTPAPPPKPQVPTSRPLACQGCFSSDFATLSHNPDLCSSSSLSSSQPPEMVMMITSSLDGLERRQAIRSTWASVTKNNTAHVRHVFLLGTGSDGKVSGDVMAESARYRDLVISDFVDTYGNLTLKTMAGLRWIIKHCGEAKFFFKTDQDMYVFVQRIMNLAVQNQHTLMTSIGGSCYQTAKPWRDPKTKYYASIRSYPQPNYPGFCSGTGYISTLNLARKIVETSPNIPFFHLEDVYLALVLRHLGYRLTRYEGFAVGSGVCRVPSRARQVFTIHELPPSVIRKMWDEKCGL